MVESVGRKLQQARLARKLEIEDVAELTKIRPDRIIDLEAGEYSHFPNLTYAKSFLAKYARFLGLDIQEELDKFQISSGISMGDYQYLSSLQTQSQGHQRWAQRIQPKGFRVPPVVVAVLILIVLVGVPVFSYLALNIPRVAGTHFGESPAKTDQSVAEPARTGDPATPESNSLKSLAAQSPATPSTETASQPLDVKTDATPPRTESGIEVRRAQPAGASQSASPVDSPARAGLGTLPEKKLEVRVTRRTYVKVTKDEEGTQPVFEGIAAPDGRPIIVEGKRFWVHSLDKGAVEVREDGQLVPRNSGDIVID